nr:acyl carrier protein [uncultured Dongia sp.]
MNKRVAAILADVFRLRAGDVHPGLKKEDVGGWDSLTQMDLVMSVEREFDIELAIGDIVRLVSVADIIAVLKEKGVSLED